MKTKSNTWFCIHLYKVAWSTWSLFGWKTPLHCRLSTRLSSCSPPKATVRSLLMIQVSTTHDYSQPDPGLHFGAHVNVIMTSVGPTLVVSHLPLITCRAQPNSPLSVRARLSTMWRENSRTRSNVQRSRHILAFWVWGHFQYGTLPSTLSASSFCILKVQIIFSLCQQQ